MTATPADVARLVELSKQTVRVRLVNGPYAGHRTNIAPGIAIITFAAVLDDTGIVQPINELTEEHRRRIIADGRLVTVTYGVRRDEKAAYYLGFDG